MSLVQACAPLSDVRLPTNLELLWSTPPGSTSARLAVHSISKSLSNPRYRPPLYRLDAEASSGRFEWGASTVLSRHDYDRSSLAALVSTQLANDTVLLPWRWGDQPPATCRPEYHVLLGGVASSAPPTVTVSGVGAAPRVEPAQEGAFTDALAWVSFSPPKDQPAQVYQVSISFPNKRKLSLRFWHQP